MSTKNKSANFIIRYEVYPFDCMFSFGETEEQLRRAFKRKELDLKECERIFNDSAAVGRTIMLSKGQTIIRMKSYPTEPYDYAILQHEIFHAVTFLMSRIGMKLCYKSDEAYAYLIEYITANVYHQLWDRR